MTVLWIFIFNILLIGSIGNCQRSLSSLPCTINSSNGNLPRHGRIVGGTDAARGTIPFIASLTRRGGHFCGATIINNRWLLTAAHCVCNGFNNILRPNQIKAVLGLHKISEFKKSNTIEKDDDDDDAAGNRDGNRVDSDRNNDGSSNSRARETTAYEIGFKNIVVHPKYQCRKPDNDIALLQFIEPITFSDAVKPACIAVATNNHNNTYVGESAFISGWGYTHENHEIGTRADVLQNAIVDIWSNRKCQESFRQQQKPHIINYTQMCAGKSTGGVDSCWADSGGPLISRQNFLIGIVSTGVGCARAGLPGIYTRVSEYTNWIENVISSAE